MLHDIFNYFINLPADTWYHTGEFLLQCGLVTVLVQAAKHARGKYADVTKRFSLSLLGLLSGLGTAVTALLGSGISLGNFGKTGAAVAGVSTFLYHILTSPLYKKWFVTAKDAVTTSSEPLAPIAPSSQVFEG